MSFKGVIEDKSGNPPMPRELTALLEATQDLLQAVQARAKQRAEGLLEEVETRWRKCNALQLATSAQGGHLPGNMALLEACSEALNSAQTARGRALTMIADPGYTR